MSDDDEASDLRLMTAVRDGDVAEMAALFERHHRPLYAFFVRMTGSPACADDLVQDVFLRLLRSRHTFRAEGSFRTWMYRVARNLLADRHQRRGEARLVELERTDEPDDDDDPHARFETNERAARVRTALARLPPSDREVLVLSRYQELRYRAIGALLGCSEGAVKVRIYRALGKLRRAMDAIDSDRGGRR